MDNNQDNDQNQQNPQNSLLTGTGGGTASPMSNPAQANRQGSGRFTNMQKYVQANQQGAQNLAQRVGTGIQNQLNAKEKDVSQASNKVKQDIDTGNQAVQTAQGQQKELANIGEGFKAGSGFSALSADRGQFGQAQEQLKSFATNPNYGAFKTFQSGNAIDEQGLNTAQQNAAQNAQNYQNLFKQRQQQIGTGTGREQALSEFVGGQGQAVRPAYSTGQRKLDQLVMGQNAQALQSLIDRVGGNQANVAQALSGVEQNATNLSGLTQAEQDTINAINQSAKAAQGNFQGAFDQNKVNEVNTKRNDEYNKLRDEFLSGYISQDTASKLGLNQIAQEQAADRQNIGLSQLSGTLDTLGAMDYLKNNPGELNNYISKQQAALSGADIVNQNDISTDKLLADIAGTGQKFYNEGSVATGPKVNSMYNYLRDYLSSRGGQNASTFNDLNAANEWSKRNQINILNPGETKEQRDAAINQANQDFWNNLKV